MATYLSWCAVCVRKIEDGYEPFLHHCMEEGHVDNLRFIPIGVKITSCKICRAILVGTEIIERHLQSVAHLMRLKTNNPIGTSVYFNKSASEVVAQFVSSNPPGGANITEHVLEQAHAAPKQSKERSIQRSFQCQLCHAKLISATSWVQHCNGKIHNEYLQEKNIHKSNLECTLCAIVFTSTQHKTQHLTSSQHLSNRELPPPPVELPSFNHQYRCLLCSDDRSLGAKGYASHLISKEHLQNIQSMQSMQQIFQCDLCCIVLFDKTSWKKHRQTPSHVLNIKLQKLKSNKGKEHAERAEGVPYCIA